MKTLNIVLIIVFTGTIIFALNSINILIQNPNGGTTIKPYFPSNISISIIISQNLTNNTNTTNHYGYTGRAILTLGDNVTSVKIEGVHFELYFDGAIKKNVTIDSPSQIGNNIILDEITVTSEELYSWDNGNYTGHSLTFRISSGGFLTAVLNDQFSQTAKILSSENTVDLVIPEIFNVYKISTSGTNFLSTTTNGKVIYSGPSASLAIQSVFNIIRPSENISISSGIYLVTSTLTLSQNHVIIRGDNETIIKASPSLTQPLFYIDESTNFVLIENIIFDGNYNKYISPVVSMSGTNNVIQKCELRNSIQYGIQAWKAQNFKIINNKIGKAQYGIATGGDAYMLTDNGLIANNVITDPQDCGIKLKFAKNVRIINNTIDVGYLTWTSNRSGSATEGASGIRFYTDDGPDYNCTASNNIITDSKHNRITTGIMVDSDLRLAAPSTKRSSDLKIINNSISDCYYGLLIKQIKEVSHSSNLFFGIRKSNIDIWG